MFHKVSETPALTFRLPASVRVPLPQTVPVVIMQSPMNDCDPKLDVLSGHPLFARPGKNGDPPVGMSKIARSKRQTTPLTRPKEVISAQRTYGWAAHPSADHPDAFRNPEPGKWKPDGLPFLLVSPAHPPAP